MENTYMKIGIDCHNLEGQKTGVGRYLWNLLKEWESYSVTLHIFHDRERYVKFFLYFKKEIPRDVRGLLFETEGNPPPADLSAEALAKVEGGRMISWTPKILNCKSNALFKHWLLPRAAAGDKIDVLFCPDYILPIYLSGRIKTTVTIHDIIYEARPEEYSWPSWADKILLKWASKQSAKKADVVFVPSEFTKSEILKYYRVNPEKIVVTPLAPDPIFRKINLLDSTSPPAKGGGAGMPWVSKSQAIWMKVRSKYGVSYKKNIFFVGSIFNRRFLPQKIQGFTKFAKNYPDFQFLIIGKNHTKPYQDIGALIAKANQELGRKAVIWQEYVSDEELVYLYNGAFATLWLSSYEGFGLPILESMACGTPIITCRTGSLPEVAGEAGLYVENPQSPEEIAKALHTLTNNNEYYTTLYLRSSSRAAEFSWKYVIQGTLDKIYFLC